MSRLLATVLSVLATVLMTAPLALANEPKGGPPDYSGVTGLYYTIIGIILAYGVYDTFFKKES